MQTDDVQAGSKQDKLGEAFLPDAAIPPCNRSVEPRNNKKPSILERISNIITGTLERGFFT